MTKKVTPYKTSLDAGNAYWMAQLANEIYLQDPDSNKPDADRILSNLKINDNDFENVVPVSNNSAQAALVSHQNYICLVFRGTDEVLDWKDNVDTFPTKALFGDFHRGFWRSFNDVWGSLATELQKVQQHKIRPVFLTGHSLGGAMAMAAAAHFVHHDQPFTSLYTFGQPRLLLRGTAQIFNMECKGRCFRFHHNNDIITRVPTRLMGYSHAGSYLYISAEQEIHQESGLWFKFLDQTEDAISAVGNLKLDAIADHSMLLYLQAVEKWQLVS